MREIIVDNFAGGGGASTGIEMAIGRSVDIAINHDPNAVAMHTTNHPDTLHYCESVYEVRPKIATAGRPVALAWFSPDCRHFSKAKGAKPVEKAIRGLAWIVIRWALDVGPRVMMLENVEEFKTWGPLLREMPFISHADRFLDEFIGPPQAVEQRPDPARAGETFEAFIGMLTTGISADHPALAECCEFLNLSLDSEEAARLVKGLGYAVEYRELRACDYGAPTIRKRFFMVMRRDGQRTDQPMPTITAGGTHVGEVKTMLAVEGYDEQRAQQVLEFLREYCGPDSTGLVTLDGVVYRIVDIGMRMLQPHELYRAQGFPEWYIIDQDFRGVKYAKDKQVARCGNAVPPPFAEALVRANLPELCQSKEIAA
ncbi:C-5 cytosine-specific DNA methylase [Enterobacter hormaechei]|uniref:DNA cytosine methyltransferase n=1 Tax=Enterobacter hormaechei TaxID=158836 RepID=UPI000794A426|nr:DNA cytosine methyltransferase [Enterobacter hormaechei]QLN59781.1 DNA cytosine methyltransferase [Enterobacter hormaechei]QLU00751.1 DNA cytosine methyltransferase [Enterobacter hormaechei]CZY62363.1 C-5 cytosine-specific DNA methylase [Enterobacter hormaechei]CZY76244.1 C-5 cytosine-specific DNA methylase [Enterobacter hormaechei]SAA35947.1 C-5 cytosine-specific DNA methylase [Enterobacter hormaechei]